MHITRRQPARLRWCRTCGRYVSKPVEEHERDPRFASFHAGPTEWPLAAANAAA